MSKKQVTRTKVYPSLVDKDLCKQMMQYLKNNAEWQESIKSRKDGFTRWGAYGDLEDAFLSGLIAEVLPKLDLPFPIYLLGAYLNWYKTGDHFTPSHTHPKQIQVIISLGATRKLIVGKSEYPLKDGDVIVFGSSAHSLPKEPEVKEERISIALFLSREAGAL